MAIKATIIPQLIINHQGYLAASPVGSPTQPVVAPRWTGFVPPELENTMFLMGQWPCRTHIKCQTAPIWLNIIKYVYLYIEWCRHCAWFERNGWTSPSQKNKSDPTVYIVMLITLLHDKSIDLVERKTTEPATKCVTTPKWDKTKWWIQDPISTGNI